MFIFLRKIPFLNFNEIAVTVATTLFTVLKKGEEEK